MNYKERWIATISLVMGIALAHIGWGAFILGVTLVQQLHQPTF